MKTNVFPASSTAVSDGGWLWEHIRAEGRAAVAAEPVLRLHVESALLERSSLREALAWILAPKLATEVIRREALLAMFLDAMTADESIVSAAAADLVAVYRRDPACEGYVVPLLFYKGFHAITAYRVGHWLWVGGRRALARWLQGRISECFAVDIHPAARIGRGIFLDHAHGFVVGETAVIEDDVSILHNVTLGGTGKESGDRHPKVRSGVLLGAGAQILGNIEIGKGAKVGAGSVTMQSVAPHVTVAGALARVVGVPESREPAHEMNQKIETDRGIGKSWLVC
ncbi:MAG: cysE [Rhodocyclales bacterium]|nr:cysE [Rhodocyclales bacterium]